MDEDMISNKGDDGGEDAGEDEEEEKVRHSLINKYRLINTINSKDKNSIFSSKELALEL
jgi:hypothetical protein